MTEEEERIISDKLLSDLVNDPRFIKFKKEREDRKRQQKRLDDWGKQKLGDVKITHDDLMRLQV